MSLAGRPSQNGDSEVPGIPPDLEYPCTIYSCSGMTEHAEDCNGMCESNELAESEVNLQNMLRAYARAGMIPVGVPAGLPFPGIDIPLLSVVARITVLESFMQEHENIDVEEYDELYRQKKLEILQTIYDANVEAVKKQRIVNKLGIVEKPGLLGPDGKPI